jgi:hypothetical protein
MKNILKQNKSYIIDLMKVTHYKEECKDDLKVIILGGNQSTLGIIVNDGIEKLIQATIILKDEELVITKSDDSYVATLTEANKLKTSDWVDQSMSEEVWQDLLAQSLVFLISKVDVDESAPVINAEEKKQKKEEKFNKAKNKLKG